MSMSPIAQIETDKVTIDVTSPEAGVIQKFVAKEGDTVEPGTKIAVISKSGEGVAHVAPSEETSEKAASQPPPPAEKSEEDKQKPKKVESTSVIEKPKASSAPPPKHSATEPQLPPKERERRVPMTRLRKRVATRLKDSQNTFALLTTFNEVDMTNLMKLRSDYKDAFVEKHGVKLGLMSGFVKSAVDPSVMKSSEVEKMKMSFCEPKTNGWLIMVGGGPGGWSVIMVFLPPVSLVQRLPKQRHLLMVTQEMCMAGNRMVTWGIALGHTHDGLLSVPPGCSERDVLDVAQGINDPFNARWDVSSQQASKREGMDLEKVVLVLTDDMEVCNWVMYLRVELRGRLERFQIHLILNFLLSGAFKEAAVSGLQNQPIINAVIDGDDIIYRDYVDISIAVGTPKGLVVPVIRNADKMNFAEIEKEINTLAKKASDGTISIDEMAGGSFTISNGGVYGSLLSTPIINPPQSAILGMHSIVTRPMVVGGNIVPRPMMYIALTYDHRLIDGREAVFFLRRIKDVVEDPRRLLLDI
ncbi:dihydrolipoamide succinyltransferase [Actinidia rufa]|uniref:Dihydrolipoamide acetyltransferase component of pyruvate dehydrogenase complex n=1 Tax=Actinidia rufa TaxID=165716 RepID=A0A7J0HFR6_9ERIC|nr:dihydrolipoamide succinyltransferase [Actinidia rufa]